MITNIRVGVVAVLENDKKEILMMLRTKEPAKGFWAIPGGKVEQYEQLEETIKRELKEELDIEVKVVELIGNIEDISEQDASHWIMPAYRVAIVDGIVTNLEPEKHEQLMWFSLNTLPENISYMTEKVIQLLKKK